MAFNSQVIDCFRAVPVNHSTVGIQSFVDVESPNSCFTRELIAVSPEEHVVLKLEIRVLHVAVQSFRIQIAFIVIALWRYKEIESAMYN